MTPTPATLHEVNEQTWPPFATRRCGPWTIRDGRGGGKRVSAATAHDTPAPEDLPVAEQAMRALDQRALFMIREGDQALDALLDAQGYELIDPVNIHLCPIDALTGALPPRLTTFTLWEPLAIQYDIWAAGGIGPGRIDVMHRAAQPKTSLLARFDNHVAAAGFVAVHRGVAMVHALEVAAPYRRHALGRHMMAQAAIWAAGHGASHMSVACTEANFAANALYASLGMSLVGHYHYRQSKDH